MASPFETFKNLHTAEQLFILPNAWDAESAVILQDCNYSAVGTSSAAVASVLGYADGECMPFTEYLMIIRRIASSVKIPVSVDMEMGYGKTNQEIFENIQKLLDTGIAGINIEDSEIVSGKRSLRDSTDFADRIFYLNRQLQQSQQSLFINVRCDTYLLGVKNAREETATRVKAYEEAGADGIFLPFIKEEEDIVHAVAGTRLPLNVMAIPGLPPTAKLEHLGVKRVSMGPFLQMKTYSHARELAKTVIDRKDIKPIL